MVREDAVTKLCGEGLREIWNLLCRIDHRLIADDDMADQLSDITVIVAWECGQLLYLSDVVAECRCDQQVTVQIRVMLRIEITDGCDRQGMLCETADVAVVYGLRGRVLHELLMEAFVLEEDHVEQLVQVRILHRLDHLLQLLIHLGNRTTGYRKIILRVEGAFLRHAEALDAQLVAAIINGDIALDIDVVEHIEFCDARGVRLPYLCIHLTGAILQRHVQVLLTVLRERRVFRLHEVDIRYPHAVIEALDKAHAARRSGCILFSEKLVKFHLCILSNPWLKLLHDETYFYFQTHSMAFDLFHHENRRLF